jgi:hypothetical protein
VESETRERDGGEQGFVAPNERRQRQASDKAESLLPPSDDGHLSRDLELERLADRPHAAVALGVVLPPLAIEEGFEEANISGAVPKRASRGRRGLTESEVATKGAHVDELREVEGGGGGRRRGTRVKVERIDSGEGVASPDTDTLNGDDGTRSTFAEEGGVLLRSGLEEPEVLLHASVDAHLPLLLAHLLLFYVTRKRSLHLPAVPATDEVDHRRLFRHRAKVVVLEFVLLLELDEGLAVLLCSADLVDGVTTETARRPEEPRVEEIHLDLVGGGPLGRNESRRWEEEGR